MTFKENWWKYLAVVLLYYTIIFGLGSAIPNLDILEESIRNLYFHVPVWFAMMAMMALSMIFGIVYLATNKFEYDIGSSQAAHVGMMLAVLGIATGMLWATYTWGKPWTIDPKLNGVLVTILFYLAYFLLRVSVTDELKRARLSAVYNVFAFVMLILFIMILPRRTASLHPGNGGNPGFNSYDLDNHMRSIFYPAVLGFILLSVWIFTLRYRLKIVQYKQDDNLLK